MDSLLVDTDYEEVVPKEVLSRLRAVARAARNVSSSAAGVIRGLALNDLDTALAALQEGDVEGGGDGER